MAGPVVMTDHDRTVPVEASNAALLQRETPTVGFPDTTPVDSNQDQTTVEPATIDPTAIDQTVVSPKAAPALPVPVLGDFEHPPLEPARIERAPANAEPKTEWMSAPKKSVPRDIEPPVDLATDEMPAPSIPSEGTGPLPELRTDDMQVLAAEPARSSADLPRQQSGWGAPTDQTEVEPKKPIPVATVEPIVPRAPIPKPAEVPSARRLVGPGARLVEIVRPAPAEPEPSTPPLVTPVASEPAPPPRSILEKLGSLEPAAEQKVIKVMQVIALILTAILVLLILGLALGPSSTPSTPLITPKAATPEPSP